MESIYLNSNHFPKWTQNLDLPLKSQFNVKLISKRNLQYQKTKSRKLQIKESKDSKQKQGIGEKHCHIKGSSYLSKSKEFIEKYHQIFDRIAQTQNSTWKRDPVPENVQRSVSPKMTNNAIVIKMKEIKKEINVSASQNLVLSEQDQDDYEDDHNAATSDKLSMSSSKSGFIENPVYGR